MYNRNPKLLEFEEFKEKLKTTSHDLNNILNNILNGLELIKDQTSSDNQSVLKIINHLEKNTSLANELLAKINNIEKQGSNGFIIINVNQLFSEIIDIAGCDDKNIISVNFTDNDTYIKGDYTELKQLFLNLIINGREACEENSTVNIDITKSLNSKSVNQPTLKFTISDNGSGILNSDLENIFKSGFSTKSPQNNTGLGLAIVKETIENHNGKINVSSIENMGTEFVIELPMISFSEQKDNSNKTVIIAEDDEFQREVLKDLLVSLKLNVFTASNGSEALELYSSIEPDILFIDEKMPKMSGLECSERISNIYESPNIVLVTGSSTTSINPKLKISRILRKPYSFKVIEHTINDLLQEKNTNH